MRFEKSSGNWLPDGPNSVRYCMYEGRGYNLTFIKYNKACCSCSLVRAATGKSSLSRTLPSDFSVK